MNLIGGLGFLVAAWLGGQFALHAAEEPVVIDFRNYIPGVVDAPVFDFDGITRLDDRFLAQLFVSRTGPDSMAPVGTREEFLGGTNAGYWRYGSPLEVVFLAVLGERIWFRVSVYERVPSFPFPGAEIAGGTPVYSMILTNSHMPMVGLESFRLMPEALVTRRQGEQVIIEWTQLGARRYEVEAADNLEPPVGWQVIYTWSGAPDTGLHFSVTNSISSATRFYRLQRWR